MTHFLPPFREPSQLKQDLNSCPKAQGWYFQKVLSFIIDFVAITIIFNE